ncbi:MAG: trypsin-like peptidase domain-containing protein, partial [Candidatus Omnitrophota bacterium]
MRWDTGLLKNLIRFITRLGLFLTAIMLPLPIHAEEPALVQAIEIVAQKVGPSVVSIKTEQLQYYQRKAYHDGDIFDQFFNDFFGGYPQYEQRREGLGSGVIVDNNGYILTNEHVVRGADTITVMLPDGRAFEGELKGTDSRSDLAVVKIPPLDMTIPPLGNSDDLKIGQWVVAIGNPFGHVLNDPQPTVTTGVISALHRALPATSRRDTDYSDLIQTDAAINPGNSGGPLVNLNGEVIGINVAIFSTSGGYQGIGFAVPVNYAKTIVDQIIKGKKVAQGWIGISIQDVDYRLAKYFNLPSAEGVLVLKVLKDAPAQQAGLADGDIILSINDVKMRTSALLSKYIANRDIGETIQMRIMHKGEEKDLNVVIGERPPFKDLLSKPDSPKAGPDAAPAWKGIEVKDITEEVTEQFRLENIAGVIVTSLHPDSPAHHAGIREGDIIVAVN